MIEEELEDLPYYFDTINRAAFVIKLKPKFIDWVKSIYPDEPILTDIKPEDENIYLVRTIDDKEAADKWMKKNYEQIFVNEMNEWTSDEKDWIQQRNFKLFNECFEYQFRNSILDMEDEMIRKL